MSEQLTGTVLRIKRSSIHDGGGLRTVVFLKGCPLACTWCSTPESQTMGYQLGHSSEICNQCGICVQTCSEQALAFNNNYQRHVDEVKCIKCFKCVSRCIHRAIYRYGHRMTVSQLVKEISKDELFYFQSDGGVTISGGEPLMQADYVATVLKQCYENGIHTAIETTFFTNYKKVAQMLPYLNLIYVDIKHMVTQTHESVTGVKNEIILENIQKADQHSNSFEIVIRIPLIPTVNDSDDNLKKTAEFCQRLKKVKAIELLPYHKLGVSTYNKLGMDYRLASFSIPFEDWADDRARFLQGHSKKKILISGREIN